MLEAVLGKPGHGKSLYLLYVMLDFIRRGWRVATNMSLTDACPFAHRVIRLDDGFFPVFQMPEDAVLHPCPRCAIAVGRSGRVAYKGDPSCRECEGKGQIEVRPAIPYDAFWHYMPWQTCYVLDEFDNALDSLDFQRIAECARDARLYFKQHRKRSDVIVYAAQNLDNVWNRVRRQTERFIACEWNYRTSRIMKHFPVSWSSFNRVEFSHESLGPQHVITEGRFWYSEARQMFSWYNTDQLVGDRRLYGWADKNGDVKRFKRVARILAEFGKEENGEDDKRSDVSGAEAESATSGKLGTVAA